MRADSGVRRALPFRCEDEAQRAQSERRKAEPATTVAPKPVGPCSAGFFSLVALLLFASVLEPMLQLPADDMDRYAWLETKRGRCLALMGDSDGSSRDAHFGGNDKLPNPARIPEEHAATLELFPATDLVGHPVRLADGSQGTLLASSRLRSPIGSSSCSRTDRAAMRRAAGAVE